MKKILVLLVLGFLMYGCKIQSMYESEPDNSFYREDTGMIFFNYDYYGYYLPYNYSYYNGFGTSFTHKNRVHPPYKPEYKPIEVKPYHHGAPIKKPNEGNKQWGDKIIKPQNQNNYHQSPSQNNYHQYSSPSRQVTQPQQNTQQIPSNSTRQGRPVEK